MDRPLISADDHDWVRHRLAAAAAGLLDDDETLRFEEHIAACEDCASLWHEQRTALATEAADADPQGERHLAPAMIARWDQARQTLRGAEREAVRRHLDRCAACRADLSAVGQRPELGGAPGGAPRPLRPGRPRRAFLAGLTWGIGVTALAAAVAGLMLFPHAGGEESAVLPWVASVNLRGGRPAILDLDAGTEAFAVLASVPAALDLSRPATVTVLGPAGQELLRTDLDPQMPVNRTISAMISVRGGVPAGEYRVVFHQPAAAGPGESWTLTFQVDVRPH